MNEWVQNTGGMTLTGQNWSTGTGQQQPPELWPGPNSVKCSEWKQDIDAWLQADTEITTLHSHNTCVFQSNDSTYSWLDELDPSEQASNTRWQSEISNRSTPRNGRKPTKHTGSSIGGHAYGKRDSLYTKYAGCLFTLTKDSNGRHEQWNLLSFLYTLVKNPRHGI